MGPADDRSAGPRDSWEIGRDGPLGGDVVLWSTKAIDHMPDGVILQYPQRAERTS